MQISNDIIRVAENKRFGQKALWAGIAGLVLSGIGCVLAVLGLALGVVQFRKTTPFKLSPMSRLQT